MSHELLLFFYAFWTGMRLLFAYDLLRIVRVIAGSGGKTEAVTDFFYWVFSGILVFSMIYQKNDGAVRGYAIVGIALGMLSYYRVVGGRFVSLSVGLLKIPLKILKKPLKRLIFVVTRCKIRLRRGFGRFLSLVQDSLVVKIKGLRRVEKKKKES